MRAFLGQLVASGALDEDATATALMDAGLRLGLGERECERTIASGMSAGMEQPRSLARKDEPHSGRRHHDGPPFPL
jgi:hypothetical protein